jgi:CheY-like chemotaxis protein
MNSERERVILVVEDDDATRHLVAAILSAYGYCAHEAANGREALAWLDGGQVPDVILLDLVMPVMDGWEFLRTCARHPQHSTIPVVVLSGISPDQRRRLEPQALRFVAKPFTDTEILEAIEGVAMRMDRGN